jgi:hypothetical protein
MQQLDGIGVNATLTSCSCRMRRVNVIGWIRSCVHFYDAMWEDGIDVAYDCGRKI